MGLFQNMNVLYMLLFSVSLDTVFSVICTYTFQFTETTVVPTKSDSDVIFKFIIDK